MLLAHAAYALGSHAFRRDDLEAAREAWIRVLLRDPSDLDAKHNLELTLRQLAGDDEDEPPDPRTDADPEGEREPEEPGPENEDNPPPREEPPGPTVEPPPDENDPEPPNEPGEVPDEPRTPDEQQPPTLEDARALLSEEALRIGNETLTLADAIALLELVRRASELEALEPRGGGGGPGDR